MQYKTIADVIKARTPESSVAPERKAHKVHDIGLAMKMGDLQPPSEVSSAIHDHGGTSPTLVSDVIRGSRTSVPQRPSKPKPNGSSHPRTDVDKAAGLRAATPDEARKAHREASQIGSWSDEEPLTILDFLYAQSAARRGAE